MSAVDGPVGDGGAAPAALPRPLVLSLLLMGLTLGALAIGAALAQRRDASVGAQAPGARPAFSLVDHTGARVDAGTYRGRPTLVYFGYTFCPDICPTELGFVARVLRALGPDAERVHALFITVDPARDTREHLAEYVAMFHPRLVGLGGSETEVAAAADAFGVFHRRGEEKAAGYYLIDHTSTTFLLDRGGRLAGTIDAQDDVQRTAAIVRAHLAAGGAPE